MTRGIKKPINLTLTNVSFLEPVNTKQTEKTAEV